MMKPNGQKDTKEAEWWGLYLAGSTETIKNG
jgi:hypothetical protein